MTCEGVAFSCHFMAFVSGQRKARSVLQNTIDVDGFASKGRERKKYALHELASLHFSKARVEPSNCWSDFTTPPVRWDPIAVVRMLLSH